MRKRSSTAALAVLFLMAAAIAVTAQKSRASVPSSEVNGTFRMTFKGKYKNYSSEIRMLATGGGKLRVGMDLSYPHPGPNGKIAVNTGAFDDQFSIKGDVGSYASQDGKCKFTIKFVKPGTIKVTQDGSDSDCGFGNNVTAAGTYIKVSSRKPKFEEYNK